MADGGLVIIGGGISLLEAVKLAKQAKLSTKVTAVIGNPFLEWPMMAPYFCAFPESHGKWVCPNPEDFKLAGVDYIFDAVTQIDPENKHIHFSKADPIKYKAVIVATGMKLPLLMPKPGASLAQRTAEVKQIGEALQKAKTIIVNGAGAVGIEVVCDFRSANPSARIILLSRSGKVADTHPEYQQELVKSRFKTRNIELMKGTVKDEALLEPTLSPGKVLIHDTATGQEELEYDVFFPAFQQGPNTTFLDKVEGVLTDQGQIQANDCLQSIRHPEIFGVGTSTVLANKHPISQAVADQAATAVKNAAAFLQGQPLKAHVSTGAAIPMNICMGHDVGGYLIWDMPNLPPPAKCCCCLPCGGGFTCCPPPCCWCKPGCSSMCGNCCDNGHGEGAELFHTRCLMSMFAGMRGYKGLAKPVQQKMG